MVAVDDLLSTDFSRECVGLELRDDVNCGLKEVGGLVRKLRQPPATACTSDEVITAEYDVARAQCERDGCALVGALSADYAVFSSADRQ